MMNKLINMDWKSREGIGLMVLFAYLAYVLYWFFGVADSGDKAFALETVGNGMLAGVMYSLVALGFVLIYKASGVFNYAQGVMCLFAAMSFAGLIEMGVPIWLALILAIIIMIVLAIIVEFVVLRRLVNQEQIILFMATIGLALFLEGFGDTVWGSDVKILDIGLPQGPSDYMLDNFNLYFEKLEVAAAVIAAVLVVVLALFFQYTKVGRALRAVADDHQAALSVGVSLNTIWVIVWSVAGLVALVAGAMWGAKSGVQFSLSLIALKALPVLIIGGFTSIPGAIIGGLIIGVGEKIAEIYLGATMEGLFGLNPSSFTAIENWFAYMLALAFLMVRPQGMFGEKIIERV